MLNKKGGEDYLYLVVATLVYLILALILFAVIKSSFLGGFDLNKEWKSTEEGLLKLENAGECEIDRINTIYTKNIFYAGAEKCHRRYHYNFQTDKLKYLEIK